MTIDDYGISLYASGPTEAETPSTSKYIYIDGVYVSLPSTSQEWRYLILDQPTDMANRGFTVNDDNCICYKGSVLINPSGNAVLAYDVVVWGGGILL